MWDQLSSESKAVILGYRQPTSQSSTKVNLHNISAADYIAMAHVQDTPDIDNDNNLPFFDSATDLEEIPSDPPNNNLLAYSTTQSLPHGDLRKVLSSAGKGKSTTLPSKQPHKQQDRSKSTEVSFASTVTIDGKTYREVNTHERMQYSVSKHKASSKGSLIDRGANGGLAGSNVWIVHKPVNPRFVDVSGIDSHRVTDLPLVTVDGVVTFQCGDVIAIMHQYAYIGEGKTCDFSMLSD